MKNNESKKKLAKKVVTTESIENDFNELKKGSEEFLNNKTVVYDRMTIS